MLSSPCGISISADRSGSPQVFGAQRTRGEQEPTRSCQGSLSDDAVICVSSGADQKCIEGCALLRWAFSLSRCLLFWRGRSRPSLFGHMMVRFLRPLPVRTAQFLENTILDGGMFRWLKEVIVGSHDFLT